MGEHVDAYRTAAPRALGAQERVHSSPAPVRPIMVFFVVFGLPGIALLSGFQSAKGQMFAGDRFTNGVIGLALLAFCVGAAVAAFRKATLRVIVHEGGLRWIERGLTRKVFWDDIASITGAHTSRRVVGAEVSRSRVHRLELENGHVLVMTHMLDDVGALAERVERELGKRLLPRHREDLASGERVVFGPLTLAKDAVELGSKRVARPAAVVVEDGVIHIGEGDARIDVEWAKVPNARILVALLES